jgi:hypothetical protein
VESGGCSQCSGGESARKQIWQFACKKQAMRRFLAEVPMITYYGDNPYGEVPDYAYKNPECSIYNWCSIKIKSMVIVVVF